jgi:hypothetical protein
MSVVHDSVFIKSFVAGVGPAYQERFFSRDGGGMATPIRMVRREDRLAAATAMRMLQRIVLMRRSAWSERVMHESYRDGSFSTCRDAVRRGRTNSDTCRIKTTTAPPRDKAINSISISMNESD